MQIKPTVDAAINRWNVSSENGCKGGAPVGNRNAKKKTTEKQPDIQPEKQPDVQPENNHDIDKDRDKDNDTRDNDKDIDIDIDKDKDTRDQDKRSRRKQQTEWKALLNH